MQATDNRCDLCRSWDYHHPDDMGVCTAENGPAENVTGFAVPIARAVISAAMHDKHLRKTATSCDTRCDNWRSDGTRKADEVEALRANV